MKRAHKPAKEQIKDLFYLHRGERRGSLFLMAILLVLLGWVIYVQWIRTPPVPDLTAIQAEMEGWVLERKAASDKKLLAYQPFNFDPNNMVREGWLALGLSERQVEGILRYTSKGGSFRVKSDVAKLYALSPADYERLEPYIQLPESLPPRQSRKKSSFKPWPERKAYEPRSAEAERSWEKRIVTKVEVNTADSASLVALPGIGPSFAKGILAYRDRLGGFTSHAQLAEVYVLKDKPEALERMIELLLIDTLAIKRIPINTCTVEELAEHPYARWKLAKPLIAYRTHHGPFRTVADIRGCVLVDEEAFRKLAPYLSVQ